MTIYPCERYQQVYLRNGYNPCYVSKCRSLWQYIHYPCERYLQVYLRNGYNPCYVSECRSLWQYIHVRDIYWFTCVSNPCYVSEYRSLWQYIRVREIYRYTWGMDIILAMFRNVVVYDNISMWEIYTGLPVNIILAMWEYRSLWQ